MATSIIKTLLNSNVAKWLIETYNGSSLAGSSQSVKSALDSLNSKSVWHYVASSNSRVDIPITFPIFQTASLIACVCNNSIWGLWLYANGYLVPVVSGGDALSATLSSDYLTVTITRRAGVSSSIAIGLFNTRANPSIN